MGLMRQKTSVTYLDDDGQINDDFLCTNQLLFDSFVCHG